MNRQLFVMDPIESIDPNHDTTYVLMKAAQQAGREVYVCQSVDLEHRDGQLFCSVREVDVVNPSGSHFQYESEERVMDSAGFELIWMREDPPFDQQYLYATYLLDRADCPVINEPSGLRNANEKCFMLRFPDLIPSTWTGSRVDRALQFVSEVQQDVVAKTLNGFGGEEVYHLSHSDSRIEDRLRELTQGDSRTILLQEFLPEVRDDGDRRVIVLGGEAIGALTRHPPDDDFRANLHSGGSASKGSVTEQENQIVETIAPSLTKNGLHLVGLDLIGDKITEVNVTSPTCVQEINRLDN